MYSISLYTEADDNDDIVYGIHFFLLLSSLSFYLSICLSF